MAPAYKKLKPVSHAEFGMWVGLASFGMLFATLFLSYGLARLRAPIWPPIGVEPLPKLLPTLSTCVLLLSSYFIHQAIIGFKNFHRPIFLKNWNLASLCGAAFVICQLILWRQVGLLGTHLGSGLFGGIFYAMTGLHVLHILGGIASLTWVRIRARKKGFFSPQHGKLSQAPKLAAMYWHFMDFIWILMYFLLIWI